MTFDWLKRFHRTTRKPANYAEKTLDAYARGMKAGGSIKGVQVQVGEDCCQAARNLLIDEVYQPSEAPILPLPDCPLGDNCRCVYRPFMEYQDPNRPGRLGSE
jgi:hypothetical protein